jgi:hypothetical protein
MELTLFLSGKNIVSHTARDALKCLDKNVILFLFSTKQFCTIKSFLLSSPLYHKPMFLSRQLSHLFQTFESFWRKVKKGKFLVTYWILCCHILTMLSNKHFNGGQDSVDSVLCAFKSTCKVREMWRGIVHSECFKNIAQRQDLVRWRKVEAYTYIKQITTKKVYTLHFTRLKNKYLWVCGFHKRCAHALTLRTFKCPTAQEFVLRHLKP